MPQEKSGIVVVVPYYNGAQWIERCVRSVFDQSVPADDIVIVNDGSSHEERAFLGELAGRYPFRIIDKENGGQGSARNVGVAASTAPFICFLDQDDFYLHHHNEDLLSVVPASDPRLGFVYGDLVWADGEGRTVHTNMLRTQRTAHPKVGSIMRIIGDDLFILPSASLISRSAYEAIGGFDPQFTGYEDDDLFLRMFRAGYTNYFLDKAVTVWCRHGGSTSWSVKMSKSRLRYFEKLVAAFVDDPILENFYFRDGLMPRFECNFVLDVERAIMADSADLPVVRDILRRYIEIAMANPYVSNEHKMKLKLEGFILTELPLPAVRALKKAARFPLLRKAVRLLHAR